MAAMIWHLNNPKGTKMNIPNAVFEVLDKKLAQLPSDKELSETEIMAIVKKK